VITQVPTAITIGMSRAPTIGIQSRTVIPGIPNGTSSSRWEAGGIPLETLGPQYSQTLGSQAPYPSLRLGLV
jgi:hypothetical protein